MTGLLWELSRFEVTDRWVSLQVNPEFKDNTVEPKGEVSQSNGHIEMLNHRQLTSDWLLLTDPSTLYYILLIIAPYISNANSLSSIILNHRFSSEFVNWREDYECFSGNNSYLSNYTLSVQLQARLCLLILGLCNTTSSLTLTHNLYAHTYTHKLWIYI